MDKTIKAAKKLAFDTGVPYYIFGSGEGGWIVDETLPPSAKQWTRFFLDGTLDNFMNHKDKPRQQKETP